MNETETLALRMQKDQQFRASPDSPLTEEQQEKFTGLRYYPYDANMVLTLNVVPVTENRPIQIMTTTNDIRVYNRYATFTFTLEGQPVTLTIYESPHGYFLPFVDGSAPDETYPAGRYLEPEELADGRFLVDFNQAYNPLCAYNDGWNCPITPAENRTNAHIRAGEMNPDPAWAESHGTPTSTI